MNSSQLTSRTLGLVVAAAGLVIVSGCSADPRNVYQKVKELEPKAEKRNQEIRELTGVPEEESK